MAKVLEEYQRKRNFGGTPEPQALAASSPHGLIFVVQKHAARRLHYDFRLEVDGVLKSWAVPKGPSYDPNERRLAVQVEDHPLDYATFEGVIPERHYGAGPVIVWDYGTYSPDDDNLLFFGQREEASDRMRRQLEKGKVSVFLRGSKLHGSWALVRTGRGSSSKSQWLLLKHRDEHAETKDILAEQASVLSGRTLDEISRGIGPVAGPSASQVLGRRADFPDKLPPMLATLAAKPFSHRDWLFEPKLDGVRVVAFMRDGRVILRGRRGVDITPQYPEVVAALASLARQQLILDGEVVALNEHGIPDFELLQHRIHVEDPQAIGADRQIPVVYYVFDLLYAEGYDLTGLPLQERKVRLRELVPESEHLRIVHYVSGDGQDLYEAVVALGLEGVVAKARAGRYEPGTRSKAWLKIKATQQQEFVICGYLEGRGHRRPSFGALVLGYYEKGRLRYSGTVGSGFRDEELTYLSQRLAALATGKSPLTDPIPSEKGTPRWVQPALVAKVKFSSWTEAGYLRAPVYQGLREDVDPRAVTRERPQEEVPSAPAAAVRSQPDVVASVCEQLENDRDTLTLDAGGHHIKVTNLNKPLWPAVGKRPALTKRDLVRYYALASEYLLPHLRDRPMNLTRYPGGIGGPSFYQKHWSTRPPEFAATVKIYSVHVGRDQEYIMVQNLPTLLWLAQLANIELHPWLSRVAPEPDASHLPAACAGSDEALKSGVLDYPDFIIFDLDPYIYSGKEHRGQEPELNRAAFARVREVALALREILGGLSLTPFLKTSGQTGLHIYVPVLRHYDYGLIRTACATVGNFLKATLPGNISMDWGVEKRTGKIFFDHNQNARGKTLASPYSLRPSPAATVSTPIDWDELPSVYPTDFTLATVPARLARLGDPWRDILAHKRDLRPLFEGA